MSTCIAPSADPPLCGDPATEERVVEGLVCALCARHAAELDAESAPSHSTPHALLVPAREVHRCLEAALASLESAGALTGLCAGSVTSAWRDCRAALTQARNLVTGLEVRS